MGSDPEGLLSYCSARGIVVQAYSPLASGKLLSPPPAELAAVAKAQGKSAAQVALKWILEKSCGKVVWQCRVEKSCGKVVWKRHGGAPDLLLRLLLLLLLLCVRGCQLPAASTTPKGVEEPIVGPKID
jgi:hypothetical protein